jgi:hypothetical protein
VRSDQTAATASNWNGIISSAFAVFVGPPPTSASSANRRTAPVGYSECG